MRLSILIAGVKITYFKVVNRSGDTTLYVDVSAACSAAAAVHSLIPSPVVDHESFVGDLPVSLCPVLNGHSRTCFFVLIAACHRVYVSSHPLICRRTFVHFERSLSRRTASREQSDSTSDRDQNANATRTCPLLLTRTAGRRRRRLSRTWTLAPTRARTTTPRRRRWALCENGAT